MANIIIKGKTLMGKTRSEQERNLRKEWAPTMNNEQLSKIEYAEKLAKKQTGSTKNFIGLDQIEHMK